MGERRGTKALELWCKRMVEDYDVRIDNMTVSWRDGLAFCALVSKCLSLKGLPCDLMLVLLLCDGTLGVEDLSISFFYLFLFNSNKF